VNIDVLWLEFAAVSSTFNSSGFVETVDNRRHRESGRQQSEFSLIFDFRRRSAISFTPLLFRFSLMTAAYTLLSRKHTKLFFVISSMELVIEFGTGYPQ